MNDSSSGLLRRRPILFALGVWLVSQAPLALAQGADSRPTRWEGQPVKQPGNRQLVCEIDKNGRFVEVAVYNLSFRKMLEVLASIAEERVVIKDCPQESVSLGFRDRGFYEAMHRFLVDRGYEIVRDGSGGYVVRKKTKEEPAGKGQAGDVDVPPSPEHP